MVGLAEKYRRHRAAFALSLELKCTPREAEEELRRRAARERDRQAQERLDSKMAAQPHRWPDDTATEIPQPWWMRD